MKTDKPSLSPFIQIVERDSKYIYINPNIPRWVVTDSLGRLILDLFNGQNTLEEIIDIAETGLGENNRKKIQEFCKLVFESGILDNTPPKSNFKTRQLLSSVHLSLSDHCNLNCTYCYARERVERKYPQLTYQEYTQIIDEIIQINPHVTFTLTGGEPLLNKNCLNIAEYIKTKGAYCYLLSNGILINNDNIERISKLFDLVTISIDGPNKDVHARTRGDNFETIVKTIELLKQHNVEYTLSMTVTRDNISYVEEMAHKFGSSLNFAPYFPVSGDPSTLAITGIDYYKALKAAAGVKPLSYCESTLDNSLYNQCHKCAIGDGEFSISATGDVYPCQLLHTDEFYSGNVHENSITSIYYESKALNACSKLDVDTIEGCKDCPIKYICGGSCRARSFYEGGRIDSSSDFCKYEQEAFYDGIIDIYSHNALN